MRERPVDVSDAAVLARVRDSWSIELDDIDYVPLGFGAHHWVAGRSGTRELFVTLDRLEPKRTLNDLEAAYAGAADLHAQGLEFVVPGVPTASGAFTDAWAGGALSATPWLGGASPRTLDLAWTSSALARLHRAEAPIGIPRWKPLVGKDFADRCRELVAAEWGPGPYAAPARSAVTTGVKHIEAWTDRYHLLAEAARQRPWVATHGEPHAGNQLIAANGQRVLIDWESLKLAPAEMDLRTLIEGGGDVRADPDMLEMFRLEWRLDEIDQYSARFAAAHSGTRDDEIAFGGLMAELDPER